MNPENEKSLIQELLMLYVGGDDQALPGPEINLELAYEIAKERGRRHVKWMSHCRQLLNELQGSTPAGPRLVNQAPQRPSEEE